MSTFDSIRSVKNNQTVYKILINGKWVESTETSEVKNPADGSLVALIQKAKKDDAEKAVQAAYDSKPKIAGMPAFQRAQLLGKMAHLLDQNREEFLDIICRESGKTKSLAEGEVNASIERLEFAEEEARDIRGEIIGEEVASKGNGMALVVKQPVGVILAITPFNYPLFTAISKIAPAIAAGNSLVVKPASSDPICLMMFGKIMQDAGLPDGVVNIITGSGSDIGDTLSSHPKIDMISFTGSSNAGKHIASIAGMKKLHLELGGKAPAIVLEDCDLNLAVKECVTGSLKFSGQRCDSISRILVVNSIADKFVAGIMEEVKKWKFGDPRNADTTVGPLINDGAAKFVDELVKDAVKKGAKLLCGGKKHDLGYYEPTVLDNVTEDMRIAWEETFGPVITVMRVGDYEQAIKISNKSNYGLDSCIFTKDINKAMDAGRRIEAGSVHINGLPKHGIGLFTFGGDKDSGIGRQGIKHSIDEMTKPHTIILHL
jgi:glyceraldehyde-3-phosphate dehydrogenase (NADP+)